MTEPATYCTCCNSNKPTSWFDGNEKSVDGKFKTCEPCRNKWRAWKEKNRKNPRAVQDKIEVTEKVCRGCNHGRGPAQPASNFGKNKRNRDGLADRCFKCQHRQNAIRRQEYKAECQGRGDTYGASRYGALTPLEVITLLSSGAVKDQTPGYWMKKDDNGKTPCWREIRDYNRAWANVITIPKVVEVQPEPDLPAGRDIGTTLLTPANLNIHMATTQKTPALRQLEMFALLAS